MIFGFHYPRSLPDWSSDDWMTYVYAQFGLASVRDDLSVRHTLVRTRYQPSDADVRESALRTELAAGAATVQRWAKDVWDVELKLTPLV